MDTLWQDLRYALRSLAKAPGFTLVTLLTLALGIGANTAIFSVVDAVLLRALPYRNPGELVVVRETYGEGEEGSVSGPNFLDWKSRNHSFAGVTAWRGTNPALVGAGEPEELSGAVVDADYFKVLGVTPILGRGFAPGEDRGQGSVVVLDETLWRSRFGADPGIVGRTISLSGQPYSVIGVVPPSRAYPGSIQVWLPLGYGQGRSAMRDSHSYDVVARLKPGVTPAQAQKDLAALARRLEKEFPESNTGRGVHVVPLNEASVGAVRTALLLLTGAVALVLLIACANVANLFLARAGTRQRELAVRLALGASRWRLTRQVLVEAVTLSLAGGLLGLLLASWAIDLLLALQPRGIPRLKEVGIDGPVLGFTLLVSLGVGVAFGLFPALSMSKQDPAESFRGEGRGTSTGRHRTRFRSALVVAQVSLALVLLVGASLLIVSVRQLGDVVLGFQPRGAMTFQLNIPAAKYADANAQRTYIDRLAERLRAIPGVRETGAVFFLPLGNGFTSGDISVEGRPAAAPGREQYAGYRIVAGNFLNALGVTLRRGRLLTPEDRAGAPLVTVVNEALARKLFPGQDPIGQRLTFGTPDSAEWRQIVGVIADVRQNGLTTNPGPELYVPVWQLTPDFWIIFSTIPISFVVRSDVAAETLGPAIKTAVRDVNPDQPISQLREAGELLQDATARQRFNMSLLTLFGLLAMILAAVGVYGVMAYGVSQRTRELGIRLALGARSSSVQALVLRDGLVMTLSGLGLGVLGALGLSRLLTTLLYGVSPSDPRVLGAAVLVLAVVSTIACLVPAIRATRVNPIDALRAE
ncbi:MAG TPA: ABC transporter permease [Gemmatimonadales bacterium]|jgi:putative ABC transport system permease protein|nr:ABC transporter permease [Gemmatimonadales bacterium]